MTKKPKQEWEEEFESRFVITAVNYRGFGMTDPDDVKAFIRRHQSQLLDQLEKEVEGMGVKFVENGFYGSEEELDGKIKFEVAYNLALQQVLELIQKMKGKDE